MSIKSKLKQYIQRIISKNIDTEFFNDKFREVNDHIEYRYNQVRWFMLSLHSHIDTVAQDILITQKFVKPHTIALETLHKIALQSDDHKFPFGTKNDNTRYPRFIKKCETLFDPEKEIKFLDLGCSGGGMVLEACLRGHIGIGLEGSNFSLINQRAEWRVIPNNLFTCDISQDFRLYDRTTNNDVLFDIITAWEVLEHLTEAELTTTLKNIHKHLLQNGFFIGSVSLVDSFEPSSHVNLYKTVKSKEWWKLFFEKNGFIWIEGIFSIADFARGSGNNSVCWGEHNESEVIDSATFVLQKG